MMTETEFFFNSYDLVYKNTKIRDHIYLNNPELLNSIHGSSYNSYEFDGDKNKNEQSGSTNSINNIYLHYHTNVNDANIQDSDMFKII